MSTGKPPIRPYTKSQKPKEADILYWDTPAVFLNIAEVFEARHKRIANYREKQVLKQRLREEKEQERAEKRKKKERDAELKKMAREAKKRLRDIWTTREWSTEEVTCMFWIWVCSSQNTLSAQKLWVELPNKAVFSFSNPFTEL